MKKLTTLILLLLSPLVIAQDKEVWACQGTDGNGFLRESGQWKRTGFSKEDALVTIDGNNSIIEQYEIDYPFDCNLIIHPTVPNYIACNRMNGSSQFVLNPDTGKAGLSKILHAITIPESFGNINIQLFQCTKF